MRSILCLLIVSVALVFGCSSRKGTAPEHSATIELAVSKILNTQDSISYELQGTARFSSGWYSYWLNPGDAGMAPSVRWTLPTGFAAHEIWFEIPQRISESGLTSFGYYDRMRFRATISGPIQDSATIGVHLALLLCKTECIAVSCSTTTVVTPATPTTPVDPSLFPIVDTLLHTTFDVSDSLLSLTFTYGSGDAFSSTIKDIFPLEQGLIDNNSKWESRPVSSGVVSEIRRSNPPIEPQSRLRGIVVTGGKERQALFFDAQRKGQ